MKVLEIKINIDNSAFESDPNDEALRAIKEAMLRGSETIRDINGNKVGYIRVKEN